LQKCELWAGIIKASDCNNPGRSSVEQQQLLVIGTTLHFGEKKGSKKYRIELGCSALAEKAFERWQRRFNPFETNVFMVHRL